MTIHFSIHYDGEIFVNSHTDLMGKVTHYCSLSARYHSRIYDTAAVESR